MITPQLRNVTVVGSYNVDLTFRAKRLPAIGETVLGQEFWEAGGGKGSNQAVAASRLGASAQFIGRIGADRYGKDALSQCERYGIATDRVYVDATSHTGLSVILIDEGGCNQIVVIPGANLLLSRDDLDAASDILARSRIVGFQLENSYDVVQYGIRKARTMGIPTLLDPAPANSLPEDIYPFIDYIKPNETEASTLTGICVRDADTACEAGRWLLDRGVGAAIVTLGERGSVLAAAEGCEYFPAPSVRAVDSTGAGDVFSGALMTRIAAGDPLPAAIRFATEAAALSVTRLGVIEAIPSLAEVQARLLTLETGRGQPLS